jgi:GT2 family glycosyltransferase
VLSARTLDLEVILVNNGLESGALEAAVSVGDDRVLVLHMGRNCGTAAGRNAGARKASGDYLLFLDSDVVLADKALENLASFLEEHHEFGIVGPLILYMDSPDRIWWSGGDVDRRSGRVHMRTDAPVEEFRETDVVPSAMLVRRDVYEDVGGFYEPFFTTFEDSDFCYSAKAKGYRVGCVCKAKAFHGIPSDPLEAEWRLLGRSRLVARNRTIFIRRHAKIGDLILYLLIYNNIYLIFYLYKILRFGKPTFALEYIKGYFEGIFAVFHNLYLAMQYYINWRS